jgi:aspartic proteinase inhibitor
MTNNPLFTKLVLLSVLLPVLAWIGFTAEDTPAQNIPGGYSAAALTEDVKTAAEFAVQEQSKRQPETLKLSNIFKAEKQIVAGVNYRLDIMVKQGRSVRGAKVVVFRDLKSHYKLTSWKWLDD